MKPRISVASPLRAPPSRRLLSAAFLTLAGLVPAVQAAVNAPITGEIERITINNLADHWSGGTIQVGGQIVILPKNLLLDLPANRLTLKQIYDQAPATCLASAETGLAKGDVCNRTGSGGVATIHANHTNAGNIIAADVFIQKGIEAVTGVITYINHTEGYFRLNGAPLDPATGVMVRINDPDSRHTIQSGAGCGGGPNCSPDPRFTLDPDNYTNVFSTGYPLCIPSTVARTVTTGLPAAPGTPAVPAGAVAQANADGSGDVLCPFINRPGAPAGDSRRFAPIAVGDSITAEGNWETVGGVRFLSAHTTMMARAMTTRPAPDQPDYLFLDEVEIDTGGFQNQRARTLFIGYTTQANTDIKIWSIHYDPVTNSPHEFPLASSLGCDLAAGAGECGAQGLVGAGFNIFKIRHDVDFLAGAKAKVNPCAHLRADPLFAPLNLCPNGGAGEDANPSTVAQQFAILSPIPHEIQARTGHSLANPGQVTLDINGIPAPNGQYLFPFGLGLGGVAFPEMNEIDLDALFTPFSFTALPWTLDRRLSPAGCIDTSTPPDGIVDCEATPQPLDPYPWEGIDPRFQASVPSASLSDPNYTATTLTDTRNRILSFVDPTRSRVNGNGFETPAQGNFNGNSTVLSLLVPPVFPPVDPALIPIAPALPVTLACTDISGTPSVNPPVANPDAASTTGTLPVTIAVLANDTDPNGDPLTVTAVTQPAAGTAVLNADNTVTFTANAGFTGNTSFTYTASNGTGGTAASGVTVAVAADILTVTNRVFNAAINRWVVRGTASPILGQTVTVTVLSTGGVPCTSDCTVGTAAADAAGAWSLVTTAGPVVTGPGQLRITSSLGGRRTVNYNFVQ